MRDLAGIRWLLFGHGLHNIQPKTGVCDGRYYGGNIVINTVLNYHRPGFKTQLMYEHATAKYHIYASMVWCKPGWPKTLKHNILRVFPCPIL